MAPKTFFLLFCTIRARSKLIRRGTLHRISSCVPACSVLGVAICLSGFRIGQVSTSIDLWPNLLYLGGKEKIPAFRATTHNKLLFALLCPLQLIAKEQRGDWETLKQKIDGFGRWQGERVGGSGPLLPFAFLVHLYSSPSLLQLSIVLIFVSIFVFVLSLAQSLMCA